VADHVHGRGGAWPHINKKRGIVRIDGGYFQAEVQGEDTGTQAQPLGLILKPTRQNPPIESGKANKCIHISDLGRCLPCLLIA
jgi:hypothetical protein